MVSDAAAERDSRPRKRLGSAALVRDVDGRVLLVEPTYKETWELPGGSVEVDESPRAACAREVEEELGLTVVVGRLLCMEWQGPEPDRSESIMYVYDGGVLPEGARISLPTDELRSSRFVEPAEMDALMSQRLARRTRAALSALVTDTLVEMESGVVLDSPQADWRAGVDAARC